MVQQFDASCGYPSDAHVVAVDHVEGVLGAIGEALRRLPQRFVELFVLYFRRLASFVSDCFKPRTADEA